MVKPGGVIVHIGLLPGSGGVDIRKITLQEVTLIGTYCYTMVDFRETVAAMAAGRLGGPTGWRSARSVKAPPPCPTSTPAASPPPRSRCDPTADHLCKPHTSSRDRLSLHDVRLNFEAR